MRNSNNNRFLDMIETAEIMVGSPNSYSMKDLQNQHDEITKALQEDPQSEALKFCQNALDDALASKRRQHQYKP